MKLKNIFWFLGSAALGACVTNASLTKETQLQTNPFPQVWSSTANTPESMYFYPQQNIIYVSNVAGDPTEKDHIGWIDKISPDGRMIQEKWITGLNAPKGMRADGTLLWVTDIDELLGISLKTGKVEKRIAFKGAQFLNDIAIDNVTKKIYVSDMLASKIYVVEKGTAKIFAEGPNLESPNGLLVHKGSLIVAAWGLAQPDFSTSTPGNLFKIDLRSKQKTLITKEPLGNLDGLEVDQNENFLVSDWIAGKVMKVSQNGNVQVLLDQIKGAADIGYIEEKSLLLVPHMNENRTTAHTLY